LYFTHIEKLDENQPAGPKLESAGPNLNVPSRPEFLETAPQLVDTEAGSH